MTPGNNQYQHFDMFGKEISIGSYVVITSYPNLNWDGFKLFKVIGLSEKIIKITPLIETKKKSKRIAVYPKNTILISENDVIYYVLKNA